LSAGVLVVVAVGAEEAVGVVGEGVAEAVLVAKRAECFA